MVWTDALAHTAGLGDRGKKGRGADGDSQSAGSLCGLCGVSAVCMYQDVYLRSNAIPLPSGS